MTSNAPLASSVKWGLALASAVLLHLMTLASAPADNRDRMVVFPLESTLTSEKHADLPDKLVKTLVRESKKRGMRTTTAQAGFDDTAMLTGCDPAAAICHQRVLAQLGSDHAIFGTVAPASDDTHVRVTIVHIGRHVPPVQQTTVIEVGHESEQLGQALPLVFGEATASQQEPLPVGPAPRSDAGFEVGRIKSYTWGLLGGGAAATVLGTVFWTRAMHDHEHIEGAPTATAADLERLVEYERSGKRNATLGNVFFFTGLAALAAGAVFAYKQGSSPAAETVTVTPMPVQGGMGVTLTLGWSP